ncbi:MAG: hypothetical protein IH904_06405 [Proteobacteria bacterium]|nr:hypothetical protein [Pseudomonadota bacterium]
MWIIAGAGLFLLVAAYMFAPESAVVMFQELVAAFGPSPGLSSPADPSPEGFGPQGGTGQ